jgi:hypothetical protein
LVLLLLAACGRLDFELSPPGHDEDHDGLPDELDPCPYIAGDDADRDGDGVGDACDPHPDTPSEHFVVFSPFTPGSPQPLHGDPLVQNADSVECLDGCRFFIDEPVATDRVVLGFNILARFGTEQHQISLGPDEAAYYFVELDDNANDVAHWVAVVFANQVTGNYDELDQHAIATDVHTGSGSIRLDTVAGPAPTYAMEAGWLGELYDAEAATPDYAGAPSTHEIINGLDVELTYLAVIETD